jgi:hypothetical protein
MYVIFRGTAHDFAYLSSQKVENIFAHKKKILLWSGFERKVQFKRKFQSDRL